MSGSFPDSYMNQLRSKRSTSSDKKFRSYLKILIRETKSCFLRCHARKLYMIKFLYVKIWLLLSIVDLYIFWVERQKYRIFSHLTYLNVSRFRKVCSTH